MEEDIRKQFPQLQIHQDLVYLDSAATTLKPQSVIDSISKFYTHGYATTSRAVYSASMKATEKMEASRMAVKEFLNAQKVEEIIFTQGTTHSINMVAYAYGRKHIAKGDEILITEMEHHANILPWQQLCKEVGATLKFAVIGDNFELDMEDFKKKLSSKTKLVAITQMSNIFGSINPIKEIAKLAHSYGAVCLVDGAQSTAHFSINVQELDVDFFCFSGHKIYGPTGIGVLYGKYHLLEEMDPFVTGGDTVDKVTKSDSIYYSPPKKFEAGTPHIAGVIGLKAAIDFLKQQDRGKLLEKKLSLLNTLANKLQSKNSIELYNSFPLKTPILTFYSKKIHPLDLATLLDIKQIYFRTGKLCSHLSMYHAKRDSLIRLSLGMYNNQEDIDAFLNAFNALL